MASKPPTVNAAMLGRIETSIMAESAIIDKDTGRVYWEGGSTTLSASLYPKIGVPGFSHLKASVLTSLLLLALVSFFAQWIRKRMNIPTTTTQSAQPSDAVIITPLYKSAAFFVLHWTILKIPNLDDRRWLLGLLVVSYLVEAYNCSTRRYLSNAISSPNEVEEYIERLRNQAPVVTWEVRCFHYERPFLLAPVKAAQAIVKLLLFKGRHGRKENKESSEIPSTPQIQTDDDNASGPFRWRKVISHQAKRNYTFDRFDDATIAGVWKRQQWSGNNKPAPFMKIVLSKILVLANQDAKEDYFRQQSQFVASEGMRDRYAEYSTNIEVPGFQRRLVAVRPIKGVSSARLFRLTTFWIFTLLGLSLPYRIFFANHADKLRVTVVKETHAEGSSSFSSWFTSSKPVPETSVALPASRKGEEIFRQQMQDMSLYAKSPTASCEVDKAHVATAQLARTETGSTGAEKRMAVETHTAPSTNAPNPKSNPQPTTPTVKE